ncbi:hypothetical protein GWK47_005180 [Chionoecetes opilio]|uniref:Uncharacterized protein n=1 Tax=Chionoecetes opilio TaxID=41210 RepID=A0A8J4YBY6_CHIOP|nr:hypothetical protein GWK47_005180 [Chionoecetes opilio]
MGAYAKLRVASVLISVSLALQHVMPDSESEESAGKVALRRQRGASKAKFRRKVKFVKAHLEKGSSTHMLKVLYEDVEKSFAEVEALHMLVNGDNVFHEVH